MRRLLPAALLALAPALAAAQPAAQAPAKNADPDQQVAGGLRVPGWSARFDRANAAPTAVKFYPMGKGLHVTAGPAAVYYDSTQMASGAYGVQASFTQMKAPAHPEAYGLVVGGQDLAGAGQSYLYYIVRGDGKYAIKHRAGADTHTITDWTAAPALKTADATTGKATNMLRVAVAADSVRFYANGQPVAAISAAQAMGSTSGVAGIRVNHNLDVHVDGFAVTKGAGR